MKTKNEGKAIEHFVEEIVPNLDSNHQTVCLLTMFLEDYTDSKGETHPEEVLVLKDKDTAMMWARYLCEEVLCFFQPEYKTEDKETRQLIDYLEEQNMAFFTFQEKQLITKTTNTQKHKENNHA